MPNRTNCAHVLDTDLEDYRKHYQIAGKFGGDKVWRIYSWQEKFGEWIDQAKKSFQGTCNGALLRFMLQVILVCFRILCATVLIGDGELSKQ